MLGNLGFGELLVIVVIGLLVFGPERLPQVARDARRLVGELRKVATGARQEIREQMGSDLDDIASLHPRRIMADVLREEPTDVSAVAPRARPGPPRPLAPGEIPPYDPDAT